MIQPERVSGSYPGQEPDRGDHVLYWMQEAVRSGYNHALEYAIDAANDLKKPLLVLFVLTDRFPEANLRHFTFLAGGLVDTGRLLEARGIRLQVATGDPGIVVPAAAEDSCLLVNDCGHLDIQRTWRGRVWEQVSCPKVIVETNTIVPVAVASPKAEWSAGTFRPKISRLLPLYLLPLVPRSLTCPSLGWDDGGVHLKSTSDILSHLSPDQSVAPVGKGGESAAQAQLAWFLDQRLSRYDESRNDPNTRVTSRLSAYLHFGQLSPLQAARDVMASKSPGSAAFLEQLIIRRELAINFVHYTPGYDRYSSAVPDWARRSLSLHQKDTRSYVYSRQELDSAATHDPYWNAMQTELKLTGYLHGYLRMYWGKKILEWSDTPEEAFSAALFLNNRYQLDGRDPNGYAGIAWCFGRHDRPWKERPVFGMIRYMNDAGLKRKFRIEAYRERIEMMAADVQNNGSGLQENHDQKSYQSRSRTSGKE